MQAMDEPADHPDANLLGAFAEKTLPKHEQSQLLKHLSICTGCRGVVALTAALPDPVGAAAAVPPSARWFAWPFLRWGALATCVVVVGAAVTFRQLQETRQESRIELPAVRSAVSAPANIAIMKPPAGTAAVAHPASRTAMTEIVPGRAKEATPQQQDDKAEAIAYPALSAEQNLAAANALPRWTLNSDGTLQRSLDSGQTWHTITVATRAQFRALAANGLEIWVGGSSSALYHSSDAGQHWTRIIPTSGDETLADDIIGIEFTNRSRGKLTTADGDVWTTADAGQSWQKK
jgi:hypothetical protein